MGTNFWSGDKAQFLLDKLAFNGGKEIQSLASDPTSVATDAPQDSIGLFGGAIYVKLDNGSTTNWEEIGDTSLLNANLNTGILMGGDLSIGAPTTTFSVSDGNGLIIDSYTDANTPVITPVSWTGLTNIVLSNIGADFTSLALNSAGTVIQRPDGFFTIPERRDLIVLGAVVHVAHTVVESVAPAQQLAYGGLHNTYDLGAAIGPINAGGNIYDGNGVNLNIDRSAGQTFALGQNYSTDRQTPNIKVSLVDPALTFNYNYQDGGGGFAIVTGQTLIDPASWDDGTGTLNTVNNNNWSIQRIFFIPSTGDTVIQYGQEEYGNFNQAVRGLSTESFTKNPVLAGALLRSFLMVRGGASDLTDPSDAVFVEADKFGQSAVGGAGTVDNDFQAVYENSVQPQVILDNTRNGIQFRDALTPLGVDLHSVQDNAGTTDYHAVSAERTLITDADGSFVVNPEFKIRNLENLKVNDAANLFPTLSANVAVADETTTPIDGYRSASLTQTSAIATDSYETRTFDVDKPIYRMGDIAFLFDIVSNAPANSYQVEIILNDGSDRTVITELLSKTGNFKFSGQVTVLSADTTIKARITTVVPNDAYELTVDNFRIDISGAEIKNFTTSESVTYHTYLSKNGSNQVKFNVVESDKSSTVLSVTNGDHTRYTFLKGADFSATAGQIVAGTPLVSVVLYDSLDNIKLTSYSQSTSNAGSMGISGFAEVGDYIVARTSGTLGADSSNFLSITATTSSEGTVFASDVSPEDIVVEGVGNAGTVIVANVTDIDFTEVSDSSNIWNGSQMTVVYGGIYDIVGGIATTAPVNTVIQLYINGTLDQTIGFSNISSDFSEFAVTKKFVTGDVVSIRSVVGATLSNDTAHRINITKSSTSIDNLIVENPNGEFETQTKFLSATTTTQGDKTDLTLTLEAGFDYILTGHITAIANDSVDNGLESWSGVGGTGTRFDSYMSNNASASNIISDRAISTYVKASEHSGFVYFYKPSTSRNVYGDGTTNFTYVTATKLPKAQGLVTGQFSRARHVTGGSEYRTYETWDGKDIYAQSFDLTGTVNAGVQTTIATIATGLLPLDISGMVLSGANWYKMNTNIGGNNNFVTYHSPTGNIDIRHDGITSSEQKFTIRYTKL